MGLEIEHKYLVIDHSYREMASRKCEIAQGYLSRDRERTVRVRIKGDNGFLTVKGVTTGDTRLEFEYQIPLADARALLGMCVGRVVSKTRYFVDYAGLTWEVDEFHGDLAPLVVAEVELPESTHDYRRPPFAGKEVTGDPAYYNSNL